MLSNLQCLINIRKMRCSLWNLHNVIKGEITLYRSWLLLKKCQTWWCQSFITVELCIKNCHVAYFRQYTLQQLLKTVAPKNMSCRSTLKVKLCTKFHCKPSQVAVVVAINATISKDTCYIISKGTELCQKLTVAPKKSH